MIKKKSDYAANPERFALIGAFDDAYAAYEEIYEINTNLIEKNRSDILAGNTSHMIGIFDIREKLLPQYIQILNDFYEKQTLVFTDEYDQLSLQSETLNGIFFCFTDIKKTHSKTKDFAFKISYKTISLLDFIRLIENIAIKLIVHEKRKETPRYPEKILFDEIEDKVQSKIFYDASTACLERRIDNGYTIDDLVIPNFVIFKSLNNISCRQRKHIIRSTTYAVPVIGKKQRLVQMPVHYCETCRKTFIGIETCKLYAKVYGQICFDYKPDTGLEHLFNGYELESKLHRLGYNVIEGELSEKERHNILSWLIDTKTMSYFEICRDIENAISIFDGRPNYFNALKKWRSDLLFLGDYVVQ